MSGTTTSATWASVGGNGNWTVPANWSGGSVPGANTNVVVGTPTVNTTAGWTVTVSGAQTVNNATLEMGTGGTLSVAGALNIAGNASLGYASVGGATVDLGAGASLTVGGNMVALLTNFQVQGGTVTTGGYADIDESNVTIANGGVWNGDTVWLGEFFTTGATVGANGALSANELLIGKDGTTAAPYVEGAGYLDVTAGGVVSAASTLAVVNGSKVTVDAASAVVVGGAPSVAGAIAIGAGGMMSLENSTVTGAIADNGVLNVMADAGASSLSAGTRGMITGALSGTGSLTIGAGYTLAVQDASGFSGSIAMAGGALDLTGLAYGSGQTLAYDAATGILTVGTDMLHVGTGLALAQFADAKDAGTGTVVMETACYAAGTRIAAEFGELTVESLRPGDLVRTAAGRLAPVRWVGQSRIDVRQHPHAAPVRIAADAFGPGRPRRDLLVSGDHAIAVNDVLIPAARLLNGASIRQDFAAPAVTYVHVELDRHDLLLAEGLAAESFLDTGNRGQMDGSDPAPRFDAERTEQALAIFAERGCARLVLAGPAVEAAQAQLRARAQALGWRLVEDPGLLVEADRLGVQVLPDGPSALRVVVPAGTRWVRLLSRSFVPAVLNPAVPDGRLLGAALALDLDGAWLPEAAFSTGWYAPDDGASWRWTDGAATLLLPALPRPAVLTLHLMPAGARYWIREDALARAA